MRLGETARRHGVLFACLFLTGWAAALAAAGDSSALKEQTAEINKLIAADYDRLEALYKHIHTHPELSLKEEHTASRLAQELREVGVEVTERVGGTGVVGVLKNGKGPTILVRTDMDALPVVEQTGVPYASKVKVRDKAGREVGVMHACGHDIHMTCWVGVARVLTAAKDKW